MRSSIGTGLTALALTILTACGGSSYASAEAPDMNRGGYPGAAPAMAEPAPPPSGADMAADFRSVEREDRDESRVASAGPVASAAPSSPPPTPTSSGAASSPSSTLKGPSEISAVRAPLLIYTAQITMAVFEVNAALAQIEDLSREVGGFLSRRDDTSITIRVPVAAFDATVRRIEKAGDMLHRNVTAQDVTEEFRDLEVRIRNARAVRDRLEQLLAKATKVEESVVVERELERVAGEIERMEGKIKFLRDRAAFSTITVSFQPKAKEEISQTPFRLPVPWLNELGLSRLLRL